MALAPRQAASYKGAAQPHLARALDARGGSSTEWRCPCKGVCSFWCNRFIVALGFSSRSSVVVGKRDSCEPLSIIITRALDMKYCVVESDGGGCNTYTFPTPSSPSYGATPLRIHLYT